MGAYKGAAARYNVVSTRLTDEQLHRVLDFAEARKISISAATDMLLMVGLEYMAEDKKNASA